MDLMKSKEEYVDAWKGIAKEYSCVAETQEGINNVKNYLCLFKELVDECFEPKQETNYEHYKEDIVNLFIDNLAVVNGKPKKCKDTDCERDCDLCSTCDKDTYQGLLINWLNQPYEGPTYKLTRFEYDLLRTNNMAQGKSLNDFATYRNLKEIGYFTKLDFDLKIDDILANCEVIQ